MSQRNVEWVIGKLVTDEEFRRRFTDGPIPALRELIESGVELTHCEARVLASFDMRLAARCARHIDPRLQKADLTAGDPAASNTRRRE